MGDGAGCNGGAVVFIVREVPVEIEVGGMFSFVAAESTRCFRAKEEVNNQSCLIQQTRYLPLFLALVAAAFRAFSSLLFTTRPS